MSTRAAETFTPGVAQGTSAARCTDRAASPKADSPELLRGTGQVEPQRQRPSPRSPSMQTLQSLAAVIGFIGKALSRMTRF